MNLDYGAEELLPMTAKLAERYTSKESSSVTYETAKQLMEAVLYCIAECEKGSMELPETVKKPGPELLYQRGSQIVLDKVFQAKAVYEELLHHFENYGCENYSDTILKGMPQFFLRYDPQFKPQDHLLTVDYPLLAGNPPLCGIDFILEYLKGIRREKRLLDQFNNIYITGLLDCLLPEYEKLYLDNICGSVLLNALGCLIAEKKPEYLKLEPEDCEHIGRYFEEDSMETTENKLRWLIGKLTERVADAECTAYFQCAARDYAVRIRNGMRGRSLVHVFGCGSGII